MLDKLTSERSHRPSLVETSHAAGSFIPHSESCTSLSPSLSGFAPYYILDLLRALALVTKSVFGKLDLDDASLRRMVVVLEADIRNANEQWSESNDSNDLKTPSNCRFRGQESHLPKRRWDRSKHPEDKRELCDSNRCPK